jgi:ribosomal protein S18 acetylase RimI-like enzyme
MTGSLQGDRGDGKAGCMEIRDASVADIPLLRALAQRIWRACYPAIISVEQIEFMLEWMYSEDQIRGEMERGVVWEVVELGDDGPIGFISYQLEPDARVKLNKIYVLPEHQRKGIGARLLSHVMERARKLGGTAVWMQVNKKNHGAVAAYQKAGFAIYEEAVFDIGRGFVMDDYLMAKAV